MPSGHEASAAEKPPTMVGPAEMTFVLTSSAVDDCWISCAACC